MQGISGSLVSTLRSVNLYVCGHLTTFYKAPHDCRLPSKEIIGSDYLYAQKPVLDYNTHTLIINNTRILLEERIIPEVKPNETQLSTELDLDLAWQVGLQQAEEIQQTLNITRHGDPGYDKERYVFCLQKEKDIEETKKRNETYQNHGKDKSRGVR